MARKITPVLDIQTVCPDEPFEHLKMAPFSNIACTLTEFDEMHRHRYFEILFLVNGSGIHYIDMEKYAYTGPVVFMLSPGQVHKIQQHEPSEGFIVRFLPSQFSNEAEFMDFVHDTCLFDCTTLRPLITVPSSQSGLLQDFFTKLYEEYSNRQEDSEKLISSWLKIIITHINRIKRSTQGPSISITDPQYALFRLYRIEVQKHFRTAHSVQFYADRLYTQARTLNAVCRKFSDRSAGEFIQDRILLEAKRALYHNEQPVKQIGYDLGFDDPAYFTRFFKKHTGLSPQEYRSEKYKSNASLSIL
jgi:AraC-type DNA-binding domain-containing proteins